jgi:hypothetical protein
MLPYPQQSVTAEGRSGCACPEIGMLWQASTCPTPLPPHARITTRTPALQTTHPGVPADGGAHLCVTTQRSCCIGQVWRDAGGERGACRGLPISQAVQVLQQACEGGALSVEQGLLVVQEPVQKCSA